MTGACAFRARRLRAFQRLFPRRAFQRHHAVYFSRHLGNSRTDGIGNKTTPVTSTVILSKEGLAGLDNWDDIRMFGGG